MHARRHYYLRGAALEDNSPLEEDEGGRRGVAPRPRGARSIPLLQRRSAQQLCRRRFPGSRAQ
eukprot:5441900-Pyramimonas_sp.AAC.1